MVLLVCYVETTAVASRVKIYWVSIYILRKPNIRKRNPLFIWQKPIFISKNPIYFKIFRRTQYIYCLPNINWKKSIYVYWKRQYVYWRNLNDIVKCVNIESLHFGSLSIYWLSRYICRDPRIYIGYPARVSKSTTLKFWLPNKYFGTSYY